ncbi:hypothetical protein [Glycomyces sp. NPDC048151]|uniref:hypothetical protein n=1 Tax=Glycomyces sp. NPDC048151 TaxID=3364002 RepID=UPI00371C1D1D
MNQIGAVIAPSTETVTIGEGDRERQVRLRVFAGDGLVTVSTTGGEPQFAGTVSALHLRRPQFRVETEFAPAFTTDERRDVREAAYAAYEAAMAALKAAAPAEPAPPLILAPGKDSTVLTVDGLRIAFTPDTAHRAVSLHTAVGSPRYIGQARRVGDAGDAETELWLKSVYWAARFGGSDLSQEIKEAAGNVWRSSRDTQRKVPHE